MRAMTMCRGDELAASCGKRMRKRKTGTAPRFAQYVKVPGIACGARELLVGRKGGDLDLDLKEK